MAKISGPYVVCSGHAEMIGRIAEAWAQLELNIDRGIWTLLGAHQQLAACLTAQMLSIHPRWKAFIALLQVRGASQKTIKDLGTFGEKVSGLSEQRNRTVHDPRMLDRASGSVQKFEVVAKSKMQFAFRPEPMSELNQTHDRIYALIAEFTKLRDAAIKEVEELPPESRPKLRAILEIRESPSDPNSAQQEPAPPPQSSQE